MPTRFMASCYQSLSFHSRRCCMYMHYYPCVPHSQSESARPRLASQHAEWPTRVGPWSRRRTEVGMNLSYKSSLAFRNSWLVIVLGVVAVAGVVAFGRGEKPAVAEDTTRIVRSFTVGSAYTTGPRYTGTVHAHTESDLGFRVSGKIIEKLIDQGEKVKRGHPLM